MPLVNLTAVGEALLTAIRDRLPGALDGGRLAVRDLPAADVQLAAATTLGALNAESSAAVPAGVHTALMRLDSGAANLTVVAEVSLDGGTSWDGTPFGRVDTTAGLVTSVGPTATIAESYLVPLQPGVTHVRVRVSAYTSGGITVRLLGATRPLGMGLVAVVGSVSLNGSGSRIGHVTSSISAFDDNAISTTLAANARGNGTTRDIHRTSAATGGVNMSNQDTHTRFRVLASGDQPFTLGVEQDSSSTISATASVAGEVAAVQYGGTGRYNALLDVPVVERYVRAYVRNGAAAQTTLRVRSVSTGI